MDQLPCCVYKSKIKNSLQAENAGAAKRLMNFAEKGASRNKGVSLASIVVFLKIE